MENTKRIILVDDDITNLATGKEALSADCEVLTVSSSAKLFCALQRFQPNLILLDADLPDLDGFETLRRLKTNPQTAGIPVILLTARDDSASHERALRLGAADIVIKPYLSLMIQTAVQRQLTLSAQKAELMQCEQAANAMVLQRRSSLILLQDALLDTLASISDNKNELPKSRRAGTLRQYLTAMTMEMRRGNVYAQELLHLQDDFFIASAQLHDVGKIIVGDSILQKPGKLTSEEFEAVKQHTIFGVQVIEQIERTAGRKAFFDNAKLFAAAHHERWDGSGYPLRLRGDSIPLQGRLMAIVDVYDALVSDRPYKKSVTHKQARDIILAAAGTHFDPRLTEVFWAVSDEFADIKKSAKDYFHQ